MTLFLLLQPRQVILNNKLPKSPAKKFKNAKGKSKKGKEKVNEPTHTDKWLRWHISSVPSSTLLFNGVI